LYWIVPQTLKLGRHLITNSSSARRRLQPGLALRTPFKEMKRNGAFGDNKAGVILHPYGLSRLPPNVALSHCTSDLNAEHRQPEFELSIRVVPPQFAARR
jgi:hypothetical protein